MSALAALAKSPALAVIVEQDGADFYYCEPPTPGCTYNEITEVTAPVRVRDFDIAAAQRARAWFIGVYCAERRLKPTFGDLPIATENEP